MTVTAGIVDWAWSLEAADLPEDVRHAACRHLLDGVGNALASHRLGAVPFIVDVASQMPVPEEATIIGEGRMVPAPMAALANGALVHGLDFDDTHAGALVHGTAAVLPAAFAVGEQYDCTGADVLVACVAGYETVLRIGRAVRHGFHARGFHATSVCGVFSAAMIAARLSGLDPATAVHAMGIAGSQAAGSLEFLSTGSATKQFHPGWSGLSGVIAARLAAEGATGPSSILEGQYGLFRAYADKAVEPSSVTDDLGAAWETTAITIKPYPLCQLSHASLDALSQVREAIPSAEAVASITFRLPEDSVDIVIEPRADKLDPRSPYEAKFSLPWDAAALVIDGALDVATFDPDRLDRAEVRSLAARVHHEPTQPGVPPAAAPGFVTVVLEDGTILTGEVAASRGGPASPLSDDELVAKFVANCGDAVADPKALADEVLHLEAVASIGALLSALVQ